MGKCFEGFPKEYIDFLWELRMNNNAEWFNENRERYNSLIKEPMKLFSDEMTERLNKDGMGETFYPAISRANRDIRFSKDKSPYKDRKWVVFNYGEGRWQRKSCFYFEIAPEGWSCGMGFYEAESEYMINGSACRLKDIQELFYDTGIGKEGYSIIGQGQIDKILSGRPEDRRELFDEAAGIVKFKRRKADALKKLEDEEQNLVRVKDILSELEKQVGPLEKQAAAAKEYFRLREELRRLDANLFLQEMEVISRQQRELEERRETVSGDMESSRTESEALLAEYDRLEEEIRKLDAATAAKQQELNETLLDSGNKEGQINVLREQIRAVERNEELTKERIEAVSREIQDKEQERAAQQTEKEGLSKRAEALLNSLTAAQEELSEAAIRADSLEQAITDGKAELIEALNEKSGLSVKKQRYDTMLEQIQVRGSEVAGKLLQMKSEEEDWERFWVSAVLSDQDFALMIRKFREMAVRYPAR